MPETELLFAAAVELAEDLSRSQTSAAINNPKRQQQQ